MQTQTKEILEVAINKQSSEIPEVRAEEVTALQDALNELNIDNKNSIILFGSSAQENLDDISNRMIEGVQNKDLGSADTALSEMVTSIRGFNMDPNKKLTWHQKLFGATKPLVKFMQEYETVREQIDKISHALEKHKSKLMTDIISLDKLYAANLEHFRKLELYIKAGETKLEELIENTIPLYETKEKETSNDMLAIQNLNEIRGFKDALERRVHDLRLSRQVTMQSLPSIRLIQENNTSLIHKITSTLVNTVPLWKNQLAQTITIFRSHDAASAVKNATDLTNELLEKNAQDLRDASSEVHTQMQRGIFDIQSIKKANQTFIATLDDSLRIAKEGKEARAVAIIELQQTEKELKSALLLTKEKAKALLQ